MILHFKDLQVWKKAMDLAVEIYGLARLLPSVETYALADQMRRAAVSIPSNIAEGQQRRSTKEFIQFLSIAKGSCAELETQLYLCYKVGYLNQAQVKSVFGLIREVGKMLNGLIFKLQENEG